MLPTTNKIADQFFNDDFWFPLRTYGIENLHEGVKYPPFNIISNYDENTTTIEMAVAGFSPDDIEIVTEDGFLKIRGNKQEKTESTAYMHKGIATRSFEKKFRLSREAEVKEAKYENGILTIDVLRNKEEKEVNKIPINNVSSKQYLTE